MNAKPTRFQAWQKIRGGAWKPQFIRPLANEDDAHELAARLARETGRPVELRTDDGEVVCTWDLRQERRKTDV